MQYISSASESPSESLPDALSSASSCGGELLFDGVPPLLFRFRVALAVREVAVGL
jgi:hypothetical protein